jgi:hypothetical protein
VIWKCRFKKAGIQLKNKAGDLIFSFVIILSVSRLSMPLQPSKTAVTAIVCL